MKAFKRLFALVAALAMVLGMTTTVFASDDDEPTPAPAPAYQTFEKGSITVENAANGEKYYAVKALDATVSEDGINYLEPIPTELEGVIEVKTENGYQFIDKIAGVSDDDWQAAMRAYANAHQSEWTPADGLPCTGNSVKFEDLDVGYYVIISTYAKDGEDETTNKVSAGSTFSEGDAPHTADGVVYEKNSVEIVVTKTSEDSYTIGDTVEYTATFNGLNYYGTGATAEIVKNYIVQDTLPEFLADAEVTKIVIGTDEYEDSDLSEANFPGVTTFGTSKEFTIPWATETDGVWTSKYANGTEIQITYTATLTDIVKVDGEVGNKNIIDIIPETPEGRKEPYEAHKEIFTYAAALKKTDGEKTLAGAKFKFKGLVLDPATGGTYTVVSYDPNGTYDDATEVEVGEDGMLYIIGLASDVKLTGKETVAPKGFNLLTTEFELEPQMLGHEIWSEAGEKEFDAEGNLVSQSSSTSQKVVVDKTITDLDPEALEIVNQAGPELPSTGGIGTTLFYVIGTMLVLGAGVVLVTKRRIDA